MIKLNNKLIVLGVSVIASTALFTSCFAATTTKVDSAAGVYKPTKNALDGGVTYKRANGSYTAYRINEQSTKNINHSKITTSN